MTPREKFSAALYVTTLVAAFAFLIFAFCRCGPAVGPSATVAKVVRSVVEAQCSDLDPVKECLDKIDQNATDVDRLIDGGR